MQKIYYWSLCKQALFDAGTGSCQKCCAKKNYLRQFSQESPLIFFGKLNKVRTNWEFVFDRHQLILVGKFCNNETIGSVAVKTMQILSLDDSNAFNQSDFLNFSSVNCL